MIRRYFYFALVLVFGLSSCNNDNNDPDLLNYDTDNITAPEFLPGDYEMAARFPASITDRYVGQFLEEVQVYFLNRPARAEIIVYGEGDFETPGDVLYSAVVTSAMRSNQWNTHTLTIPVEIPATDLWLSVKVRHLEAEGSVGCDIGPANVNGDLLLSDGSNQWSTLRDFTNNAININWNIRGVLSE